MLVDKKLKKGPWPPTVQIRGAAATWRRTPEDGFRKAVRHWSRLDGKMINPSHGGRGGKG